MSDEAALRAFRRMADRLADRLSRIEAKLRRPPPGPPVLDADPDPDDDATWWAFADGQLNFRAPSGTVYRFRPDLGAPIQVPTFSSAPAFSSGHRIWYDGATGNLKGYLQNGTLVTFAATAATSSTAGGGPTPPPTSTTVPKPADPTPTKHVKTYGSTWERAYCSKHGDESDLHYGYYPGAHGERRCMFGFDYAQMQTDLAGADILKVEIKGQNIHSWASAGVTIHFGTHTKGSQPGSYSANRKDVYVGDWPHSGYGGGSDDWRTTTKALGRYFRDGSAKGLTIDNPSSTTGYGEFDRDTLKLRITYVTTS